MVIYLDSVLRETWKVGRRARVGFFLMILVLDACGDPLPQYPEGTTVVYNQLGGQPRAYLGEIQFSDYPTSVDSVAARVMAIHAHKARGISGACTILYRIHSAHSATPLSDANAEYGTMFAEAEGGCGSNARRWEWKRTLFLVEKPERYAAQAEVVAGESKAFGLIPIIRGATFVREESRVGGRVTRYYHLALPKAAIRDFYRRVMPAQLCSESALLMDQGVAYQCAQRTYDIVWETPDSLSISR